MDKARFLIEAHLRTGRPVGELAKAHGVSRGWLYKLLARYNREGPAGLEPRSRRPHRSPAATAGGWPVRRDRAVRLGGHQPADRRRWRPLRGVLGLARRSPARRALLVPRRGRRRTGGPGVRTGPHPGDARP